MLLSQLQKVIHNNPSQALHIMLPDGSFVPAHFHVTEVGLRSHLAQAFSCLNPGGQIMLHILTSEEPIDGHCGL